MEKYAEDTENHTDIHQQMPAQNLTPELVIHDT